MTLMRLFVFVLLLCLASQASAVDTWYTPNQSDGMDTWFGNVYNKGGMPTDYRLRMGGWGDQYNGLLRFNLSGLPQVATQAVVWLYTFPDSGTPVGFNWLRVLENWQEDKTTWSNQPVGSGLWSTPAPARGESRWYGVDITNVYNSWRRGDTSYLNFGFRFSPTGTNNQFVQFYSSDYASNPSLRPTLYVKSATTESKIALKWPLATSYTSRVVTTPWKADWVSSCDGLIKKHNGTDYRATSGTVVYATEDGLVKQITDGTSSGFAYAIVIEHNHPSGAFTTVSWHVNPTSGVVVGAFIPKGMKIATVAHIDPKYGDHFHLGIRKGSFDAFVSTTGGLPQKACVINGHQYPAFPANFINPEDTTQILFQ